MQPQFLQRNGANLTRPCGNLHNPKFPVSLGSVWYGVGKGPVQKVLQTASKYVENKRLPFYPYSIQFKLKFYILSLQIKILLIVEFPIFLLYNNGSPMHFLVTRTKAGPAFLIL